MRLPCLTLALVALFAAPALAQDAGAQPPGAQDVDAEAARCRGLETEKAALTAAGIPADMEKGPQWASANLPKERLQKIGRFIEIDEQLKFRCPDVFASAAVKAEEARALQAAKEAQAWAQRLEEAAKNPPPPERKPITAVARTKARDDGTPPLPERATR